MPSVDRPNGVRKPRGSSQAAPLQVGVPAGDMTKRGSRKLGDIASRLPALQKDPGGSRGDVKGSSRTVVLTLSHDWIRIGPSLDRVQFQRNVNEVW
jgi:hypothetical protein